MNEPEVLLRSLSDAIHTAGLPAPDTARVVEWAARASATASRSEFVLALLPVDIDKQLRWTSATPRSRSDYKVHVNAIAPVRVPLARKIDLAGLGVAASRQISVFLDALGSALDAVSVQATFRDHDQEVISSERVPAGRSRALAVDPAAAALEIEVVFTRSCKVDLFGLFVGAGSVDETKRLLAKRAVAADLEYVARARDRAEAVPGSNGSRVYSRLDKRVGVVCDEWLFNCWADAVDLIYLSPSGWRSRIKDLDVVVISTVWHGLQDSEWSGATARGSATFQRLSELVAACRDASVPVVFFSAEDPPHFDDFIDIAKLADVVFTCCVEKIPDYIQQCGHSRVHQLPFAFNPAYHHPVGTTMDDRERGVIFAGSWMLRYPERQVDTELLFDGILDSDTEFRIVDRNFSVVSDRYIFPEKYFEHIVPALDHDVLQRLHKTYPYAVNLNAVKYSATMFANRVVELQAMGIALISNYSLGVAQEFPNVKIYVDSTDVAQDLRTMSRRDLLELRMDGIRRVYRKYCVYDVLREMLTRCGIAVPEPDQPTVLVVADLTSDKVRASIERQSFAATHCVAPDELSGVDLTPYAAVAFMSDEYEYGVHYLEDLFNGFRYTGSSYVAKDGYLDRGNVVCERAHQFVDRLSDKYRAMFWAADFTTDQLDALAAGQPLDRGYAIDPLNVTRFRPARVPDPLKRDLTVIVPIYNNGEFLKFRAFASLKRSSVFQRMKILLVDDGSTDAETLEIVHDLADRHVNVDTYFFPRGGSGSASRPRNKGVSLATTPFVTFLDPDNEAINDGYAQLLASLEAHPEAEVAMGEMTILRDRIYTTNLSHRLRRDGTVSDDDVLQMNDRLTIDSGFGVQSMQAMVFRTEFVKKSGLKLVEGAYAEDSLFHYELMSTGAQAVISDLGIHNYYGAIASSGTNTVGPSFFERTAKGIQATFDFFERVGFLREYVQDRFTPYLFGWLMDGRFSTIQEPHLHEACAPHLLAMIQRALDTGYVVDQRLPELARVLEEERWDDLPGRRYLLSPDDLLPKLEADDRIVVATNDRVLDVTAEDPAAEIRIPIARVLTTDLMSFDSVGTGVLLDAGGALSMSLELRSRRGSGAVDWQARVPAGQVGSLQLPVTSRTVEVSLVISGAGRAVVRGLLLAPKLLLDRSQSFPGSAIALDRFYGVMLADRADRTFVEDTLATVGAEQAEWRSRTFAPLPFEVAIVCDPLLYEAYAPCLNLHYVSSVDPQLPVGVDALLVAATWGGIDGGWDRFKPGTAAEEKIKGLIAQARRAGIPVAYIGKDDPSDFEHFAHVARECDHVFTMAGECIEPYRDLTGHDNVHLTTFSFDPTRCNPIGSMRPGRSSGFVFGGAWYGDKFPERRQSLEMLFDGLIGSGAPFHLVLRTFDSLWPMFQLPERYMRYAAPAVDHDTLVSLHQQIIGAVNANSVVESDTMFATRVVELQAMGNFVVSTPSRAISRLFPAVQIPSSVEETSEIARDLTSPAALAVRMAGVRSVFAGYSSYDVVARMLRTMGLPADPPVEPGVCVVAHGDLRELRRQFDAQSYAHKRLISLDAYQGGVEVTEEAVAFWSDRFAYGPHYLEDMVNAFKYTDASYVSKGMGLRDHGVTEGPAHEFIEEMPDRDRTVFWRAAFADRVPVFDGSVPLPGGYAIDPLELDVVHDVAYADGSDS